MSELAKVFSTDVLIIGGGISGLCAANKAADQGADVLITDKSTTGWCGQMPASGGAFTCPPTPDMIEAQVKFYVKEGEYLNDQEWTYTFVRDTFPCIEEMSQWGLPFHTDSAGRLDLGRAGGTARCTRAEMALPTLLGRVLRKGARVLNKVYMVNLLKRDGRIVGAFGFHYQTGDAYIVQSKATIICSGGCNYKSRPLFHINCGEGVAIAYDAGAEIRNAEFANHFMVSNKFTLNNTSPPGPDLFENALGESLVSKYPEMNHLQDPSTPPWLTRAIHNRWVLAWYKEIEASRGPIYCNLIGRPERTVGFGDSVRIPDLTHGYVNTMKSLGIDLMKEKVEWKIVPEFHAGPIRVDTNCETTLPGLYATGDAVQNGSAYWGAREGCGLPSPLSFAMVTGFRAGRAAGKAVSSLPETELDTGEVDRLKEEMFAPLAVKDGFSPYDAIKEIQAVVFKLKNSYIKHNDRERDDKNWLKWIIITKEGEKMKLSTEPVPIDKYKYRPD